MTIEYVDPKKNKKPSRKQSGYSTKVIAGLLVTLALIVGMVSLFKWLVASEQRFFVSMNYIDPDKNEIQWHNLSAEQLSKLGFQTSDGKVLPMAVIERLKNFEQRNKFASDLISITSSGIRLPEKKISERDIGGAKFRVTTTYAFDVAIDTPELVGASGSSANSQEGTKRDERYASNVVLEVRVVGTVEEDNVPDAEWKAYIDDRHNVARAGLINWLETKKEARYAYKNQARGEYILVKLLREEAKVAAKLCGLGFESKEYLFAEDDEGRLASPSQGNYDRSYIQWNELLLLFRQGEKEKLALKLNELENLSEAYLRTLRSNGHVVSEGEFSGYRIDGSVLNIAQYALITLYINRLDNGSRVEVLPDGFASGNSPQFCRIADNLLQCVLKLRNPDSDYQTFAYDFADQRPSLVSVPFLYYALKTQSDYAKSVADPEERVALTTLNLSKAREFRDNSKVLERSHLDTYTLCFLKRSAGVNAAACMQIRLRVMAGEWQEFANKLDRIPTVTEGYSNFYKPLGEVGYLNELFMSFEHELSTLPEIK